MDIFDELQRGVVSSSPEETQLFAMRMAKALPEDQVIKLQGTLGTGKTTFIQGLAKAWNIRESVKSPTFNLYSIYQGSRQLIHLDAYRLNDPAQAEELLIEEFLVPPYCLAIEWPENVTGWMNEGAWHLRLSILENQHHRILLSTRPQ